MQSADDLGRELDGIWLGPPNSFRWPVDWTFKKWGLFGLTLVVSFFLFALLIPMGFAAGAVAWWGAQTMAPTISRDSPRRWHWALLAAISFVLFVLVPSPRAWLLPVWLPLAFVLAPAAAAMAVRMYGRFLTWNTPFGYWTRMLRLVASGPRLRVTRTVDPMGLLLPIEGGGRAQKALPAATSAILPAFRPVDVLHVTAGDLEADNGGWHVDEAELKILTPPPAIEAVVLKPSTALAVRPMPPKRHPFVVRVPGGLYFHRLNYRIDWGPR